MYNNQQKHVQLRSLMEEMLSACVVLEQFTNENCDVFLSDDDKKIMEVIQKREEIVNTLIDLECRIDLVLHEDNECAYGKNPPLETDEIKKTIRSVLSAVSDMDMEAMKTLGSKMQKYRNETIKARNRKHLSAYIRSSAAEQLGNSYDYKK